MRDIIVELSSATPTIMVELEASGPKGDPGRDFSVLGYFFTLEELEALVENPTPGDAYGVGQSYPYDIYIFDGAHRAWVNNGHLQGPAGAQGERGEAGKDFTVLGFFSSLTALEAAITNPGAGDAYGIGYSKPYDIYIWDGSNARWVDNGPIQGAKGDTGERGPAGPQGERGFTGSPGPRGETGLQGPAGPQGERGERGIQGERGETGLQGPQGIQGIQGERGERGETGLQGPAGPQGEKGDPFRYSDFTPAQLDALRGPQGIKGDKGDTGATGTTYTPAVSSAGVISWTNDGGKPNPQSVDLVAAVLAALPNGDGVSY